MRLGGFAKGLGAPGRYPKGSSKQHQHELAQRPPTNAQATSPSPGQPNQAADRQAPRPWDSRPAAAQQERRGTIGVNSYKAGHGRSLGSPQSRTVGMVGANAGFSRYAGPASGATPLQTAVVTAPPTSTNLLEVMRGLAGSTTETVERGKTIFFPGDPAEKVYLLRRGAVRLSRVYESGEEITVALLRENSLFGVLSLLTGQRSDRFYHAVAFTRVEMVTAPAASVKRAIEHDAAVGLLMLQGLSSRILQTETMIETLTHRDMSSRLVSFL